MRLLSELIIEQEQNERKYLAQIVKLSHVREVMNLLCEWIDDFHWFVDCNTVVERYIGANTNIQSYFTVKYDAFNGYQIDVNVCRKGCSHHTFDDYTGIIEDDAAKIYEIIMKELI